MPTVVGVAFRPVTKVYFFDPEGLDDLQPDEHVIVETSRGRTMGQVVFAPRPVSDEEVAGTLKPVVRRATAFDMVQADQMAHREPEAQQIAASRAQALGMSIKVSNVEFNFDGSSAIVYFTSEQRVDFRNLVHDLSAQLRTRVEMRQVGVQGRGEIPRRIRQVRPPAMLRELAPRVHAGVDQDGQDAGFAPQRARGFGCLWAAALLPGLRERLLHRSAANKCRV